MKAVCVPILWVLSDQGIRQENRRISKAMLDKARVGRHTGCVLDTLYPLIRAGLFRLDPEVAHHLSLGALRLAERTGMLRLAYPGGGLEAPVEVLPGWTRTATPSTALGGWALAA